MQAPAKISRKTIVPAGSPSSLIVIGASVRSAAQSATRAGLTVIGLDLYGDTDTLAACQDHHSLTDIRSLESFCQRIPRTNVMVGGGFRDSGRVIDLLARDHVLLGPQIRLRQRLNDPRFLCRLAGQAGLRFPATVIRDRPAFGHSPADARSGRPTSVPIGPTLRKNFVDSGGLGVRWANRDTAGPGMSVGDGEIEADYLQQWIGGRSFGATLLGDGVSARLLGVCRSAFSRRWGRPFVYAGSHGPVRLAGDIVVSLDRLGSKLTRLGLVGLFNVDLIVDSDGCGWLLEINPRWSGSSELIERSMRDRGLISSGESLMGLAHRACCGPPGSMSDRFEELDAKSPGVAIDTTHCKRVVFAGSAIRFDRQRLGESLSRVPPDRLIVELCDLPEHGRAIGSGEPILSLVASIDRSRERKRGEIATGLLRRITAIRRASRGESPSQGAQSR